MTLTTKFKTNAILVTVTATGPKSLRGKFVHRHKRSVKRRSIRFRYCEIVEMLRLTNLTLMSVSTDGQSLTNDNAVDFQIGFTPNWTRRDE